MSNTTYAEMEAENTHISFNDHNGNLEIIPSNDDYFMLTQEQMSEFIKICTSWYELGEEID